MSLPEIANLEVENVDSSSSASSETVHKTIDWDFDTGDFRLVDGKFVELTGLDYLTVWIQKALKTLKDSSIYAGSGYGSEHAGLIGGNFRPEFMKAEMERTIREALLENDAIMRVDNFSFAQEGARLIITFEVGSTFGTTSQAVTV